MPQSTTDPISGQFVADMYFWSKHIDAKLLWNYCYFVPKTVLNFTNSLNGFNEFKNIFVNKSRPYFSTDIKLLIYFHNLIPFHIWRSWVPISKLNKRKVIFRFLWQRTWKISWFSLVSIVNCKLLLNRSTNPDYLKFIKIWFLSNQMCAKSFFVFI